MAYTYSILGNFIKVVNSEESGYKTYHPDQLRARSDGSNMVVYDKYQEGHVISIGGLSDYTPTAANLDTLIQTFNDNFFSSVGVGEQLSANSFVNGAFGEQITLHETPIVQASFVYSNNPYQWETFSATGGSVTNSDSLTVCQTGTNVGGYGLIRTLEYGVYRPGQGLSAKFTASFTTGVALSRQAAGFIASEIELSFGYNGTDFCVLRRTAGALEIQTLTLSSGASSPGNVTIELDGSSTAVAITSGTAAKNAWEISQASFTGWNAYQSGDTVVFIAKALGDKTNAFSFTDTDTTGAAASFAETRAGSAATDTFINQTAWNVDRMDGGASGGPNPSGMTLDPTKLNVYKIDLQYLGAGKIDFYIESENTGKFQLVHTILYANKNTTVSIHNPTLKIGWFAASLGSTTNLTVTGASGQISLQGEFEHTGIQWTTTNFKSGIGGTLTNLFTIRVDEVFKGLTGQAKLKLEAIDIGVEASGNNVSQLQILRNATLAGTPNYSPADSDLPVSVDTAGTDVTNGELMRDIPLSKSDSRSVDLTPFEYTVVRGDTITIAANVSGGSLEARASLTYEILI